MEKELLEHGLNANRRKFISRMSLGLGSAALGSLLIPDLFGGKESAEDAIMKAMKLNRQDAIERAKHFSWDAATDQFIENLA